MSNFWSIFKKKPEKRELEYVNPGWSDGLLFNSVLPDTSAMAISAINRGVNIIADSLAMCPVQIIDKTKHHIAVLDNHPVKLAFNSLIISESNLKASLIRDVLLAGNGFAYISRAQNGTPIQLTYLPRHSVSIHYNALNCELYYNTTHLKIGKILPEDIIHLRKFTKDGVNGISVLVYANRALSNANAAENQAEQFFSGGSNLSGLISVDGQLSAKQRDDIKQAWQQTYNSPYAKGIAVLQSNCHYQSILSNPADSQLLETRKYNIEDLARFLGIPAIMLTGETPASLEIAQNQFILNCLAPYIQMFEEECSNKLFPDSNLTVHLDTTALLKIDKQATANYYNTLIQGGVICINECRAELGLNPVEGGDKHIIAYTDINQNTINKEENQTEQG